MLDLFGRIALVAWGVVLALFLFFGGVQWVDDRRDYCRECHKRGWKKNFYWHERWCEEDDEYYEWILCKDCNTVYEFKEAVHSE